MVTTSKNGATSIIGSAPDTIFSHIFRLQRLNILSNYAVGHIFLNVQHVNAICTRNDSLRKGIQVDMDIILRSNLFNSVYQVLEILHEMVNGYINLSLSYR